MRDGRIKGLYSAFWGAFQRSTPAFRRSQGHEAVYFSGVNFEVREPS